MNKLFLPILILLALTACRKENDQFVPVNPEENTYLELRGERDERGERGESDGKDEEGEKGEKGEWSERGRREKIAICHLNDEGEYALLEVAEPALRGHLGHGDFILDADGDGYTALGACAGSANDCDDNDPSIHPGNLLSVTVDDGTETYTLYVHPTDNHTEILWGSATTDIPGLTNKANTADALVDFNGAANTQAIVDALQDNGGEAYAAKLCADLVYQGCDDWYLPALGELKAIYDQLGPNGSGDIEGLGTFWSSTEQFTDYSWRQSFFSGGQFGGTKDKTEHCRCVRR
jgi:hypothetical protein